MYTTCLCMKRESNPHSESETTCLSLLHTLILGYHFPICTPLFCSLQMQCTHPLSRYFILYAHAYKNFCSQSVMHEEGIEPSLWIWHYMHWIIVQFWDTTTPFTLPSTQLILCVRENLMLWIIQPCLQKLSRDLYMCEEGIEPSLWIWDYKRIPFL
jgi:hypothetical protein